MQVFRLRCFCALESFTLQTIWITGHLRPPMVGTDFVLHITRSPVSASIWIDGYCIIFYFRFSPRCLKAKDKSIVREMFKQFISADYFSTFVSPFLHIFFSLPPIHNTYTFSPPPPTFSLSFGSRQYNQCKLSHKQTDKVLESL